MITELLISKRTAIVKNWIDGIFDTYESQTSGFLAKDDDRFSNPVGFIVRDSAEKIVDVLITDRDLASVKILLVDILKIRAVQEFSPSEAVKFVFLLKDSIRVEIENDQLDAADRNELRQVYSFIDNMALAAFDVYMELRETIHRIRLDEVRNKAAGMPI